jgi:hypothetical protein
MSLRITFENKGNATLVDTDGERATLECDFSSPPGSPLMGHIVQSGQRVELKVHGCSRVSVEARQFVIRGRWVNLSRVAKAELLGSRVEPGGPAKA